MCLCQVLADTDTSLDEAGMDITLEQRESREVSESSARVVISDSGSIEVTEENIEQSTNDSLTANAVVAGRPTVVNDLSDIACWPLSIPDSQRVFLVRSGPRRVDDYQFPVNDRGRHFSSSLFTRKLSNGESIDRRWLVYSTSADRIFCFCCKLFANFSKFSCTANKFSTDGFCNWNHTSRLIKEHEVSCRHIEAHQKWVEMEVRLNSGQTLDRELQRHYDSEKLHWRNVLERLLSVVQFLAQRNLAFRGTSEQLEVTNNGNFLGLVELFGKFDPVLSEHIRRIRNDEIHDHYLGNAKECKMSLFSCCQMQL